MKRQTDPYGKTKKYIFKQIAQKLTQVFPCPPGLRQSTEEGC